MIDQQTSTMGEDSGDMEEGDMVMELREKWKEWLTMAVRKLYLAQH